jgi:phosphatidate cytidylyltransferase
MTTSTQPVTTIGGYEPRLIDAQVATDPHGWYVAAFVVFILLLSTLVGYVLKWTRKDDSQPNKTIDNLIARTKAWWVMAIVFMLALLMGKTGVIVLFAFISFMSLREVLTLSYTRRADHHALFWAFFVAVPMQYFLIWWDWYGLFSILLPVWGFLFFAVRIAMGGDTTRYLERFAKVFAGLMVCVYCVSHAPALLLLDFPNYQGQQWKLLIFLVTVVQFSDVMQYVWGKLLGKTKIAPGLSPSKTVEGFVGGVLTASLVGMGMWWMTPFAWWQAGIIALVIALMGFFGGLVMSAIKRDAGVKDYGHLIEGHGGMTDRIDSIAFSAPVFFHLIRWWFQA